MWHAKLATTFAVIILYSLTGCGSSSTNIDDQGTLNSNFNWQLGQRTPLPVEPADNPMSEAKFQLGRHLFYDPRLSGNGTQSCATCHHQDKAFTDGLTLAVGSTAEVHPRNSQSLTNVAYNATFTWANSALLTLEKQAITPLFGEAPIEQGINDSNRDQVLQRIIDEDRYRELFESAFPDQGSPIDFENIVKALASFVRGLTSFESPFDAYEAGNDQALSAAAKRGMSLFFSERLECFHCHGGYNFSDSTIDRTMSFLERPFHNTGLFNVGGTGNFPANNTGLFAITGDPSDMGKFRAPTLRNIAKTAPYMHDGSIASLSEVLDFYAAGGRVLTSGPNAGDGRLNPFKDGFITGFSLTVGEKSDLIIFLESLTDENFLTNPRLSNPWE